MKKRYFQFKSILKNHNCASVEFSVNKQNGIFNFAHVSAPKYHMRKPAGANIYMYSLIVLLSGAKNQNKIIRSVK
jgi:hypothetical protein